jgi:tetratricopeptide (TPR) repeat protein
VLVGVGCSQPASVLVPEGRVPDVRAVPVLAAAPGDGFDRALAWMQAPAADAGADAIDYAPLSDRKLFEGLDEQPPVPAKAEGKGPTVPVRKVGRVPLSLYFEGRTLWHRRQFTEAIAKLERARTLDPRSYQVNLLLGRIYLAGGSRDLARQRLDAAISDSPDNFEARYFLGTLHFLGGNWAPAATELKAALANRTAQDDVSSAKAAQAWLYLGRALQQQEQWTDAVRCYRQTLSAIERGVRATSQEEFDYHLHLSNPSTLYVWLSECFDKSGAADKALLAAEHAVAVHAAGREANVRLIGLQIAGNRADKATETARRFAEAYRGPDRAALELLEDTFKRAGRPADELIEAVRAVRKRLPDSPTVCRFLAEKLKAAGKGDEAVSLFEELKALESPTPEGIIKLAELREQQGDRAAGLRVLARGVFHTRQDDAGLRKLTGAATDMVRREKDLLGLARRLGEQRAADDPAADYLGALAATEARQFDQAATLLERVIQMRPRFVQMHDQLAQVHMRQAVTENDPARRGRRLEQALRVYTRAIEAGAADAPYFRRQAARVVFQIYMVERARDPVSREPAKRLATAKTMLEAVIKADPADVESRALLVEVLLEQQDPKAALAEALELTRRRPDSEDAALALLRVLIFARELERAVSAADEFLRRKPDAVVVAARKAGVLELMHDYPGAIAALRGALSRADAEQKRALRPELVDNLLRVEDHAAAIEELKTLIEEERKAARPDDPGTERAITARRTALARIMLQAERVDDARNLADEIYKDAAKDPSVLQLRLVIAAKRKDDEATKASLEEYRRVIRELNKDVDDKTLDLATAEAYSAAGRGDLAEKTIRDRLAADRDRDPVLRMQLARILAGSRKDYDQAAQIARELLEEVPGEQGRLMVLKLLGSILSMQKKLKEAADVMERAYTINRLVNPDDVGLDNDLGYTWADLGINLEKARDMIQRAVDAEPYNAAYRDSLGWVMYKLGDLRSALTHLKRATAAYEGADPVLWDHLGDTHWRLGEKDAATAAWKRSVELFDRKDRRDPVEQERVRGKVRDAEAGREPPVAPLGDKRNALGT